MTIFLIFVAISLNYVEGVTEQPDFMKKVLNIPNLQMGYGEDCYLNFRSGFDDYNYLDFKCGTRSGLPLTIEADGDKYRIKTNGGMELTWTDRLQTLEDYSAFRIWWDNIKKHEEHVFVPEFRNDKTGGLFWIREQPGGKFALGFTRDGQDCPLMWDGDATNKFAYLTCGYPIANHSYWIKGSNCRARKLEIPDKNEQLASLIGNDVIGRQKSGACNSRPFTLTLSTTDQITDEVEIEMGTTEETSSEESFSISIEASGKVLGVGFSSTATVEKSFGQSVARSRSTSTGTSSSAQNTHSFSVPFDGPGAGLLLGYARRYEVNRDNVDAEITAVCPNGHTYTYETKVKLRSKVFSEVFTTSHGVKFKPGKCKTEYITCLNDLDLINVKTIDAAFDQFNGCFPRGTTEPAKKRKIKKMKTKDNS